MTQTTLRIIEAIKAVPKGKVSSYRDIGFAAGLPNGARQVARILHSMTGSHHLPWHRIVKADGAIAFPPGETRDLQIALLRSEGVMVNEKGQVRIIS
ncbi:MAG: MGMT family protein [Treponema sp.]|jgi:methylated-DNA-protein-cysteine methyltransferase-like protein|nr:MGMT family protein [Treponema sp.]